MNILFSTTYYHPYISGLSLYIRRLAEALCRRNHSVSILCMNHDDSLASNQVSGGVQITRARPLVPLHKGFLSVDFVRLAWVMVKKSDVVVINLPQFEGFWPALFGRMQQKKVIATYHSELNLPSGFINSIVQRIVEIANLMTLYLSGSVVTYTQDFADNSRLLRHVIKKVVVSLPPVPVPIVRKGIMKRLLKHIGSVDVVIGVAARLASEKGLEYLFAAVPQLISVMHPKRLKIVIAGPDTPVGERAYREKIRKLERLYSDTLVFLGEVSPDEMGSFYALLDVLVLPSVNSTETFGMVQVEAMMTGVPVVASDLAGVRVPIRRTGMGIVVSPRDSVGLASAIEKILKNPAAYKKDIGSIRKQFDQRHCVDFYEKLFCDQ